MIEFQSAVNTLLTPQVSELNKQRQAIYLKDRKHVIQFQSAVTTVLTPQLSELNKQTQTTYLKDRKHMI